MACFTSLRTGAADPLEIEPLHTLSFSESSRIYQIALTPDGRELFVQLDTTAINLAAMPLMYWPQIGGLIVALVLVWCVLRIRRAVRHPQRLGEPHCRRCGYCLTGCPSDRCPECGRSTRRPRVGRGFWRRTWLAWALMLLVVGPYAAAWLWRVPRGGPLAYRLEFHSEALVGWVARHKLEEWFPKPDKYVSKIVVIHPASGRKLRELPLRSRVDGFSFSMETTPDGSGLFVRRAALRTPSIKDLEILLLDAVSGAARARLPGSRDEITGGRNGDRQILGFSEDGDTAYVRLLDQDARKVRIVSWRFTDGEQHILLERDAEMHPSNSPDREMVLPQRFFLLNRDPIRFLEAPSAHGLGEAPATFRVHRLGDAPRIESEFLASVWGHQTPQVWREGNQVWLSTTTMRLQAFDLTQGKPLEPLPAIQGSVGRLSSFDGTPEFVRRGRLLIYQHSPAGRDSLAVLDARTRDPLARVWLPRNVLNIDDARLSHDGRWLAARITLSRDATRQFQDVLCIFDLAALDTPATNPAAGQ